MKDEQELLSCSSFILHPSSFRTGTTMPSPDPQDAPMPRPGRRSRRWWVLGGVVALLVLGTVVWLQTRPASPAPRRPQTPSPPDPRLTYTGPYRNIHPEVGYVGDGECAACHALETASYRKHAMGRSLTPVRDFLGRPPHDDLGSARFEAFQSVFTVERRGERVFHRQTRQGAGKLVYSFELEADYVIGSGARGYSFLSDRGGTLYQTPVSWFSQKGVWDLSPGFSPRDLPGRTVVSECLFCHANRANPREDTVNTYDRPVFDGHAIGCERCHGPGELHVKERGADI